VRLVYRKQRDLHPIQQAQHARGQQPFRGNVEKIQLTREQRGLDSLLSNTIKRRVEEGGADTQLGQGIHLILHQGNQRRDDDADTLAHQSRNLITQRLAPTRRHQRQDIAPLQQGPDDVRLMVAERTEAESRFEEMPGPVHLFKIPVIPRGVLTALADDHHAG
jgi:hypothetical protein